MIRIHSAILALLLVAACGGGQVPPSKLDNACSIVADKPKYHRAFKKAERKWGVPVHVQMATVYQESRFVKNARTPHNYALGVIPMGRQSSAFGYAQALDGTWDDYRDATGNRGAKRTNIHDAADFMGWYMNKTRQRNGVSLNDARNQYLAYHEGQSGFARGSHNNKSWLLRVADRVDRRSDLYRVQLASCR